jgi:thioredoxin-dependent peroxiredoxin
MERRDSEQPVDTTLSAWLPSRISRRPRPLDPRRRLSVGGPPAPRVADAASLDYSVAMAKTPQVGEQAPDFELPGTEGPFKLSEHRGERVVLLFYPGDNTMVCTKQFCSYRDRADDFAALDATVIGVSSQDLDSHKGFIEKNGLTVPLLADVDKAVGKAYSASRKRAVVVIDEQGVVRHRHDHLLGLDYQSVDDLKAALDALPSAPSTT